MAQVWTGNGWEDDNSSGAPSWAAPPPPPPPEPPPMDSTPQSYGGGYNFNNATPMVMGSSGPMMDPNYSARLAAARSQGVPVPGTMHPSTSMIREIPDSARSYAPASPAASRPAAAPPRADAIRPTAAPAVQRPPQQQQRAAPPPSTISGRAAPPPPRPFVPTHPNTGIMPPWARSGRGQDVGSGQGWEQWDEHRPPPQMSYDTIRPAEYEGLTDPGTYWQRWNANAPTEEGARTQHFLGQVIDSPIHAASAVRQFLEIMHPQWREDDLAHRGFTREMTPLDLVMVEMATDPHIGPQAAHAARQMVEQIPGVKDWNEAHANFMPGFLADYTPGDFMELAGGQLIGAPMPGDVAEVGSAAARVGRDFGAMERAARSGGWLADVTEEARALGLGGRDVFRMLDRAAKMFAPSRAASVQSGAQDVRTGAPEILNRLRETEPPAELPSFEQPSEEPGVPEVPEQLQQGWPSEESRSSRDLYSPPDEETWPTGGEEGMYGDEFGYGQDVGLGQGWEEWGEHRPPPDMSYDRLGPAPPNDRSDPQAWLANRPPEQDPLITLWQAIRDFASNQNGPPRQQRVPHWWPSHQDEFGGGQDVGAGQNEDPYGTFGGTADTGMQPAATSTTPAGAKTPPWMRGGFGSTPGGPGVTAGQPRRTPPWMQTGATGTQQVAMRPPGPPAWAKAWGLRAQQGQTAGGGTPLQQRFNQMLQRRDQPADQNAPQYFDAQGRLQTQGREWQPGIQARALNQAYRGPGPQPTGSQQQFTPEMTAQINAMSQNLKQRQATEYPGQQGSWGLNEQTGQYDFTPNPPGGMQVALDRAQLPDQNPDFAAAQQHDQLLLQQANLEQQKLAQRGAPTDPAMGMMTPTTEPITGGTPYGGPFMPGLPPSRMNETFPPALGGMRTPSASPSPEPNGQPATNFGPLPTASPLTDWRQQQRAALSGNAPVPWSTIEGNAQAQSGQVAPAYANSPNQVSTSGFHWDDTAGKWMPDTPGGGQDYGVGGDVGAGWSMPGQASPNGWSYDLGGGWREPGVGGDVSGLQAGFGPNFDPQLRGRGYDVFSTPSGQDAPQDQMNYTPGSGWSMQGQLAPRDLTNYSLVAA